MKERKKIKFLRYVALVILAIFSLAITPWSILHHHEAETPTEKNCKHSVHVKSSVPDCLVCHVHFEKNYTQNLFTYIVHLKVELLKHIFPILGNSFVQYLHSSLRGPPSQS